MLRISALFTGALGLRDVFANAVWQVPRWSEARSHRTSYELTQPNGAWTSPLEGSLHPVVQLGNDLHLEAQIITIRVTDESSQILVRSKSTSYHLINCWDLTSPF